MKLKNIILKNFRCYEELSVSLDDKYTILVGSNGSGKTAILEAISIALGGYISYFDKNNYGINKDDSLYKMYQLGSKIERVHQFPVEIKVVGEISKDEIEWERALKSEKGRTSNLKLADIKKYTDEILRRIREGDKDLILPMVAYYGTSRLWMQKRDKKKNQKEQNISRLKGYVDCLSPISNEKLMLKWFEDMTYLKLQEGKRIPELETVEKAVSQCYKSIDSEIDRVNIYFNLKNKDLEISREFRDGRRDTLPLRLLSDGIKSTLSMVADIAYRMAILNPELLDNIKEETPGIILIDEIDMHLHPAWQKKIIKDLCEIFPKIQFLFTTHSPTVISNSYAKHLRILGKSEIYLPQNTTYGREIDSVLREIMDIDTRPEDVIQLIEDIYDDIDEGNLKDGKKKLKRLEEIIGDRDNDFIKAKISIDLEESMREEE